MQIRRSKILAINKEKSIDFTCILIQLGSYDTNSIEIRLDYEARLVLFHSFCIHVTVSRSFMHVVSSVYEPKHVFSKELSKILYYPYKRTAGRPAGRQAGRAAGKAPVIPL